MSFKILVTGANGQVGSALLDVARLEDADNLEVIGLSSSDLDITEQQAVHRLLEEHQPDFLINAAAYTAVDKAEEEPALAKQVNTEGPRILAAETANRSIPILHFSTDYVFDGTGDRPYRESDPVAPLGVYGITKYEGEEAVRQQNPRHVILRTSWVFGVHGHNFPKTMLRLAAERDELGVVADQRGCPTFAGDIAIASLAIVQQYRESGSTTPWGVYHYSGAEACTWYEFACWLIDKGVEQGLLEKRPRMNALTTAQYPTPASRPANSCLDCRELKRQFPGIQLSDWKAGIQSLISAGL